MQETLRELVNRVLSRMPSAPPLRARQALNERLRRVEERCLWSWLNKEGFFTLEAEYSSGAVTVRHGAASLTGIGTAWSAGHAGRLFRLSNREDWYFLSTVASATAAGIDAAFESASAASASYRINRSRYSLASDVSVLEDLFLAGGPHALQPVSLEWLNASHPDRSLYGEPTYYAHVRTTGTTEEVEVYPVPVSLQTARYLYRSRIASLSASSDTIPPEVRADVLIAGVLADLYMDAGKVVEAGAQEAIFRQGLEEMVLAEAREERPTRMGMAPQYTAHRRSRRARGRALEDWIPWNEDAGY